MAICYQVYSVSRDAYMVFSPGRNGSAVWFPRMQIAPSAFGSNRDAVMAVAYCRLTPSIVVDDMAVHKGVRSLPIVQVSWPFREAAKRVHASTKRKLEALINSEYASNSKFVECYGRIPPHAILRIAAIERMIEDYEKLERLLEG